MQPHHHEVGIKHDCGHAIAKNTLKQAQILSQLDCIPVYRTMCQPVGVGLLSSKGILVIAHPTPDKGGKGVCQ